MHMASLLKMSLRAEKVNVVAGHVYNSSEAAVWREVKTMKLLVMLMPLEAGVEA